MSGSPWERRWLTTTRGRLLALLRRDTHTVDELAQALDMTDNAVRSQLALLERDGLVRQQGVRRGTSKPALVYALTPDAERPFQKAYAPVLRQLLDTLARRLPPEEVEEIVLATGRGLAATQTLPPPGDHERQMRRGVEVLNALGGLAELEPGTEEDTATWRIRGYRCLLSEVTPSHPEACRLTAALLSEVVGQAVEAQCQREGSPQCCFVMRQAHAAG